MFTSGKRDSNESKITAILDHWKIPFCLMPPRAGFDILVLTSPIELWEVKSPDYKWTLTKAEQERKRYCEGKGIIYRVIEYSDQAADALAERQKGTR